MMDALFRRRRPRMTGELDRLDGYLHSSLKPVLPTQEFVADLQRRLIEEVYAPQSDGRPAWVQFVFLTTGVILSVSLVMITGLRILVAIAGLFGRLSGSLRQPDRSEFATQTISATKL